jgi:leucyl aminopeptidase (aminopeptidase T)
MIRSFISTTNNPGTARELGIIGGICEGEVHFAPPNPTIEGTVIIDGPMGVLLPNDNPDKPIKLDVKEGKITSIEGGADAERLKEFLTSIDGFYISEVALGINPHRIRNWTGIQYQKSVIGNLHVAYGGWWGFQDRESVIRDRGPERASEAIPARIHGDMVIHDGSYEVDGKAIMKNGTILV